MDYIKNPRNF
jgi:hypothetical protein